MEEEKLCATDQRIADRNLYRSRLINLVRLNPILWDKKSPDFNQRVAKINKWREVAGELGVSTDKMRRTWENLRDQYRRDLKRAITTGARSKWRFFNDMNFIRSMVRIKGSNQQRQSDSESDYEELINDNYKETFSVSNMFTRSSIPVTATLPTTTTISTNNSNDTEPKEFLPIKLNTEWKQRAALEELQHTQQQAKQEKQKLTQTEQKQYGEEQPQQDCDSSEEQKYDDEVYEAELSHQTNVIKIEIDSDSNDESLLDILQQKQPSRPLPQPSHPQPLKFQQQPEPAREPRPSAPRPELSKHESEEFVSTSVGAIKSRKRRLSTQTDATAEDHYQSCSHAQRQNVATDSELQDEDYHFVMSILPALRQVTRLRKFPLRSQIMTLISKELEESND